MTTTVTDAVDDGNPHRAIQNEYILEHLFSFLSVNDIKNCRLTNRTWRNIGTKFLRRRTHIFFEFSVARLRSEKAFILEKRKQKTSQMKEIGEHCRRNSPTNIPISSFKYAGEVEYSPLNNFLEDVRSCMTELTILSRISHEKPNITVDLSPKIPSHLTKLHIHVFDHTSFTFSLCLAQISFVKDISLNYCTIIVNTNEKRLSPNAITLGRDNKYMKNGVEQTAFTVNDNFDLKLTKHINLQGEKLILDFSDCANDKVERIVSLKYITVQNWGKCNWKIKKFSLKAVSFLDNNFIEMEELTTEYLRIDLSKIYNPASILKLHCNADTVISEAPFFLPNLVEVTLESEDCVKKLPFFRRNQNISKMRLKSEQDHEDAMSVQIEDLPNGISHLSLGTLNVRGGGLVYPLKTLCLGEESHPIYKYHTIASKFQVQTLRIDFEEPPTTDEELENFFCLLNVTSYGRLICGGFYWEGTATFNDSVFPNFVDKMAEFYVFEDARGKGLTKEEADKECGI